MTKLKRISIVTIALIALFVSSVIAQNYNVPLSLEGLNHTSTVSVLSRSMGGVSVALKNDISLMFTNPASLSTLDALTISAGISQSITSLSQTQQWYPLFSFGSFSTLMDGSTRGIVPTGTATSPSDTNWVPFDNLGPNWKHDNNSDVVPNIFIGMPVQLPGLKISVGLGYAEYANMNYFYQNNNDLSPEYDLVSFGSNAADSIRRIDWYQSNHARVGSLHSFGGAISFEIKDNFSIGYSMNYISGSTDDYDVTVGRGVLWFYSGPKAVSIWGAGAGLCMRVDSAVYAKMVSGTSDYSGYEINISAQYRTQNVTVGGSITAPMTMTREFKGRVVENTEQRALFAERHYRNDVSYTDIMYLPIKGKIGIGIQLRPNVFMAAEYEYLPYGSAELEKNGTVTKPWLDGSAFHVGIRWEPLDEVSLRFGYSKQKEVFAAQYTAFKDDPISYNTYSVGLGTNILSCLALNVAYEYYQVKYEDVWAQSYHINTKDNNNLSAQLIYTFQ